MAFDWSDYYQNAYERLKRENTILASQVADREAQLNQLTNQYNHIAGNPLYKAARAAGKVRHIGKALQRRSSAVKGSIVASPELIRQYEEELARQKDPYGQWIASVKAAQSAERNAQPQKAVQQAETELTGMICSYRNVSHLWKEIATQDAAFILFAEEPEYLDPDAIFEAGRYLAAHPDTIFWYAHEDCVNAEAQRVKPYFKPAWSPDTLLGFFYPGSYFAVRTSILRQIAREGLAQAPLTQEEFIQKQTFLQQVMGQDEQMPATLLQKAAKARVQIYALALAVMEQIEQGQGTAGLTDQVLYHIRLSEQPDNRKGYGQQPDNRNASEHPHGIFETTVSGDMYLEQNFWGYEKEYLAVKESFLRGQGLEPLRFLTGEQDTWSVAAKAVQNPLISVIIPSKDHPEALQNVLESFCQKTTYRNVEFLIVDNGSSEENREKIELLLQKIKEKIPCRYLYQPMEFNFSGMCNIGARAANGKYLLLLNDDIEIIQKDWLTILLGQALIPGTGAVGAKLWYPQMERIQHAGITNLTIGPAHKLVTFPDDRIYYYGHNSVPYDMIGVTAACLLIRRSIYDEVGGMNEAMKVAYNDVDFCFRVYEKGYYNVQRNDAVLYHHESLSRGLDEESPEKQLRLQKEKEILYTRHPSLKYHDPFYPSELSGQSPEYVTGYQYPYEDRKLTVIPERKESFDELMKLSDNRLMLTVERAGRQLKNYLEERDILEMEGWCYFLDADNCCFERSIILAEESANWYYQIPVQNRFRYDVEAILPKQHYIALSGFTARIEAEEAQSGQYRIGMLYRNKLTGQQAVRMSERMMTVDHAEQSSADQT